MIASARGSFRLLLRNELRLYLRSGQINGASVTFLVIAQVLLHLVALAMMFMPSSPRGSAQSLLTTQLLLSSGLIGMLLLMLSRALAGAVQSLYTRADLDLLLSSPVDRRAVIGVRIGSIALTVALEVALLVWPFANVFVLFGREAWFKAYLLVPAMAMLATSIGLAVTLLCFRTLGPRRTRVTVQVFAVLTGLAMMLAFYLPGMFQQGRSRGPFGDSLKVLVGDGSGFRELLVLPAQWVMQGFVPTLACFAAALLLIILTIQFTGDRVVLALTATQGAAARRRQAGGKGPAVARFGRHFRTVIIVKELKLVARDPFLLAQILQQSLMVLPMAFVLWRSRAMDLPLAWLSTIWLAAGLAGPLSWLTIIAEDAPDLLASAPVSRAQLVRAKLAAALLPTLPICLLPLFFLPGTHPWYAVCLVLSAFGAALCSALLNMRNPLTQRRDSFRMRYKGRGASGLVEVLSMGLWMLVCLALTGAGALLGWR